ncbi:MAG: Na+/H+ antiporter subunit C [Planctomycetota bacterium]|nr:MAG: Na+/H+ antiporter subunit C [Planctomycetota bacterium]REJ87521.1 MAG: Na+/H+ antiporter subunit C [Planctomycetota bacterium]REK31101.1 MAG: Na+/H+ antiporter subunit C [Planctomycetota bacterium]REK44347.1 MAG: Na+/H+ antiporter subunit C [Planctomycetota bacterium]
MEILLAITIGALYAAAFYMLLRRSFVKVILGLAILSHAANLFLFTVGGLTRGQAPLLSAEENGPAELYADPLPQALILTAIVIGFGVQAFALVLFKRVYQSVGSDDLDSLTGNDSEL